MLCGRAMARRTKNGVALFLPRHISAAAQLEQQKHQRSNLYVKDE